MPHHRIKKKYKETMSLDAVNDALTKFDAAALDAALEPLSSADELTAAAKVRLGFGCCVVFGLYVRVCLCFVYMTVCVCLCERLVFDC